MASLRLRQLTLADWSFLILFPGFFFYQSAIGTGMAPAILGGYFSPVCILLLPFLALVFFACAAETKHFINGADLVFGGFLLYFFFVVALNFGLGAPSVVVKHHLVAMLHFVVVFITCRLARFDNPGFRRVVLITVAGMSLIIFAMSVDGTFYLRLQGDASNEEALATYQGFARSYLLAFLVVAAFLKKMPHRLLLYAVCIPALFINGARSEMAVAVAAAAIIEGIHSRHRGLWIAGSAITGAALFLFFAEIASLFPGNRSGQLLDLSGASSWEARSRLFFFAVDTVLQNPVFGSYGSYLRLLNNSGSYAHNIVSAWVDLGLFGFLYLFGMLAIPTIRLGLDLLRRGQREKPAELIFAFIMLFVTLVMLFTSKSFTYMVIAGAMGVYANYRSKHVQPQGRPSHLSPSALRHTDLRQAMPQPGAPRL
jgi:hypothetical protein